MLWGRTIGAELEDGSVAEVATIYGPVVADAKSE